MTRLKHWKLPSFELPLERSSNLKVVCWKMLMEDEVELTSFVLSLSLSDADCNTTPMYSFPTYKELYDRWLCTALYSHTALAVQRNISLNFSPCSQFAGLDTAGDDSEKYNSGCCTVLDKIKLASQNIDRGEGSPVIRQDIECRTAGRWR